MSRTIGQTVETLMRRVRQEGALALEVDFATEIYSRSEQLINTALKRVLATTTLALPKEKLIFDIRTDLPTAIEIIKIEESSRRIFQCSRFSDFAAYELSWFRSITGTRIDAWMQYSRDILILYPGQSEVSSVDVTYVELLTLLTDFESNYNTVSQLPDEDIDLALSLAEIVLLSRFRLLINIPSKLETFVQDIGNRGFEL